ncbi:hypothetical protein [Niallia sp. 03190]
MRFKPKKKKDKAREQKWELIDIGFNLLEPLYLFVRFIIRSIVKMIN